MAYKMGTMPGQASLPGRRGGGLSISEGMTVEALASYVQQELQAIEREFNETSVLELRPINAEPKKPREGMIVFADGTDWNPGAGKGTYTYSNGAWEKI